MLYNYTIESLVGSDRFHRYEAFANHWSLPPTEPRIWLIEPAYADSPTLPGMTVGAPDDGHPPAQIA
ncbi:MAG: hypothetical protein ABIY55_21785 [Kofleriaceae bacterium]